MISSAALALALSLQAAPSHATPPAQARPNPAAPPASAPGGGSGVRNYGDVVISPDATKVADLEGAGSTPFGGGSEVVVRATADGAVLQRFSPCATPCRLSGLAWSPDGARLAMVWSDDGGQAGLVTAAVGPGSAKPAVVAQLKGLLQSPRWSPDGRAIAVLAVADPHKLTGATQAGAARVGEIGDVVDEQRIAVVPAAGGAFRMVSPSDTYVYEYDWTPDGQGFVGTAAKGDGDDNWWVAELEAFPLGGGARVIAAPKLQMNFPRVSPDGRTVAFIGGLMSDFGSVGGDVYTVPTSGGEPKDVTPGYRGTFTSIVWRGAAIKGTALVGPDTAAVSIDPATDKVEVLARGPFSFSAGDGRLSWSGDGRTAAASVQSFTHPPALGVHTFGQPGRAITHDNDALTADLAAKSIEWTHDGEQVQGWLLSPLKIEPGKTYPMVVDVHGGPAAASVPSFVRGGTVKDLLDHGYFVFMPNPRGSYGQGEAFVQANKRDFGGADLGDILAGVDAVEKVAPIDDKRLGIYGGSYGGFMTMWAVTHTNRFHAAVAGAGLSDWMSYYGENGIDQWMIPYFGASAYDDPAIYDKLSPIRYIRQARTPTFIEVGERDIECPPGQSIEFWHGLKAVGVPTSLVIYPGEGHGIRQPAHTRDLAVRILGWFDDYLKAPRA